MSSKSSVVCGQPRKPQMMNSIQLLEVLEIAAKLSERSKELKLGLFSASVGETERRTLFMEIKVVLGDTQNATAQNPMQLELTFWGCHLFEQGLAQKAHEVPFSLSNPAFLFVYCKEEHLLTIHKPWVCDSFSMAKWSNSCSDQRLTSCFGSCLMEKHRFFIGAMKWDVKTSLLL